MHIHFILKFTNNNFLTRMKTDYLTSVIIKNKDDIDRKKLLLLTTYLLILLQLAKQQKPFLNSIYFCRTRAFV